MEKGTKIAIRVGMGVLLIGGAVTAIMLIRTDKKKKDKDAKDAAGLKLLRPAAVKVGMGRGGSCVPYTQEQREGDIVQCILREEIQCRKLPISLAPNCSKEARKKCAASAKPVVECPSFSGFDNGIIRNNKSRFFA